MKTIEEKIFEMDSHHSPATSVAVRHRTIICMGDLQQGDEAAALHVASHLGRRLQAKNLPDTQIREVIGGGTELVEALKGASCVFLIATVVSGQRAGYVYRFDLREEDLPHYLFSPCLDLRLELAEALEMARQTDEAPDELILYAIEGTDFTPGAPLSPEVEKGVQTVVQCLMVDLG